MGPGMSAESVPEDEAAPGTGPQPETADSAAGRPAIVVVSRHDAIRERVRRELARRYDTDYQVVTCDYPPGLAAQLRALRTTGIPVALVIGGVSGQDPDEIEVFAAVRPAEPHCVKARRASWRNCLSVRESRSTCTALSPGSPIWIRARAASRRTMGSSSASA